MRHFSTKMTHCAVPEILVNLYSMLGSSWNSIALGLNESSFWPYDYHFTHFLENASLGIYFVILYVFQLLLQKSTFSHKMMIFRIIDKQNFFFVFFRNKISSINF